MPTFLPEFPKFQECAACEAVYPWSDRPDATKPTPCCNSVQPQIAWPDLSVATMLELARQEDLSDHDRRKIAVVMMAAALEQLQDQIIMQHSLAKHCQTAAGALALLEAYEGKAKRSALYKRLTEKSLPEVLQPLRLDSFVKDWNDLAQVRNKVAHGQFFTSHLDEAEEIELLKRLASTCVPAFAALSNHARVTEPPR